LGTGQRATLGKRSASNSRVQIREQNYGADQRATLRYRSQSNTRVQVIEQR